MKILNSADEKLNLFLDWLLSYDYSWKITVALSSLSFEDFLKIIVIYLSILWISIIIWVTKDIINRSNNILLQIISILTVLFFTPLWIFVYLLIRPTKTLFEKYYEEEMEEFEIEEDNLESCLKCENEISPDFKFCPNCWDTLVFSCIKCKKDLNPKWSICPYCWKDQDDKIKKILEDVKKIKNS